MTERPHVTELSFNRFGETVERVGKFIHEEILQEDKN